MANWEIPSFDTDLLEAGKFYVLLTDKDNATLLIEKPTDGSFIFSNALASEDFIIEGGIVRLNPNVIKQTEFDVSHFIVGLDGVVHLKNPSCSPTTSEGVTINFSPVITNTQTCEDDDGCGCGCSPQPSVHSCTVNGATTVKLTSSTEDFIELKYKITSGNYLEGGIITILNDSIVQEHTNRITNTILKDIGFNAILDSGGISLVIAPPTGEMLTFSFTIITI